MTPHANRHGRVRCHRARRVLAWASAGVLVLAPVLAAQSQTSEPDAPRYDISYAARLVPAERSVHVSIETGRGASRLKHIRMRIDPERHTSFEGDGEILENDGSIEWTPPSTGGQLRYIFRIDHLRNERTYDARCAKTWAIFRGGDMVPPVRVRQRKGARSRSTLSFVLPEGWSVALPHTRLRGGSYRIDQPGRAFSRPTGWMVLGDLGVVRESIAETSVAIAGPARHGLRRMDILALLSWTLPELNRVRGTSMERLVVVGAGDPMWRGGLSGPSSLFLHAERPLITQDGTSPILHEVVHTAMSARADDDFDWIVEGMAEYYSIQLLARTGTLSSERIDRSIERIRSDAASGRASGSHGGLAADRGTIYMIDLDESIRQKTDGAKSIDDVFRAMVEAPGIVDLQKLRDAVETATGFEPDLVMPAAPAWLRPAVDPLPTEPADE